MEIPYGTCHCGCGEETALAEQTNTHKGWIRGKPKKWIMGHQLRKSPREYVVEDRGHETPCWAWQRFTDEKGYARLRRKSKKLRVHRIKYEGRYGPIPPGHDVHHLCDTKSCINPEHLIALPHGDHSEISARESWPRRRSATT